MHSAPQTAVTRLVSKPPAGGGAVLAVAPLLGALLMACGSDSPAAGSAPDSGSTAGTGGTSGSGSGGRMPSTGGVAGSGGEAGASGGTSSTDAQAPKGAGGASFGDAATKGDAATEGDATACAASGESCAESVSSCCGDLICVGSTASNDKFCRQPCTEPDDCASQCCVLFEAGNGGFCAPSERCQCAAEDETCGGTRRCCDGLACSTFDETGDFACKPLCQRDADCETRCCQPITGTDESVCLTADWCGR